MRFLNRIERLLLVLGLLLIAIFVAAQIHRAVLSRAELRLFRDLQAQQPIETSTNLLKESGLKVDFSLWSPKRIAAYQESLAGHMNPPLAVLRIPKVHLEVPVLEGTDDLTLNLGVGHIPGTARVDDNQNIGIAGHRDGFFRALKDVGPGDVIELLTLSRTRIYVVDQIVRVRPDDVSVLQPRSRASLTLVTCYPFYFVGSAPQRYIVQASVASSDSPNLHVTKEADSEVGPTDRQQSTR